MRRCKKCERSKSRASCLHDQSKGLAFFQPIMAFENFRLLWLDG